MGCGCGGNSTSPSNGSPGSGDTSTYNCKSFLPAYNGETFLSIRDKTGIVRHKIYHNTLAARYLQNNVVFLKIVSDNKIISLTFASQEDARCALIKLSDVYNQIRQNYSLVK